MLPTLLLLLCLLCPGLSQAAELGSADIDLGQGWRAVTLPDHWSDQRPVHEGTAWYRLQLDIERPEALLGVYLKRACNNVWIYANGQLLYSGGGPMSGPRVYRMCHFPVLASWPREAQRPGRNELLIRIHSDDARSIASEQRVGHLSTVVIDRWQVLQPVFNEERTVRMVIPQVTAALMGLTGLALLLLWARHRRDPVYLHLGAAMILGSLGTARVFITEPPLDNVLVERLIPAVVLLLCASIASSLVAFNQISTRFRPDRLWSAALAFSLVLLAVPASAIQVAARLSYGAGALIVTVIVVQLAGVLRRERSQAQTMFVAAGGIIFLTGLHDYLVQLRVLTYTDRPLIQVALPLLMLGLVMRLLSRHAEALETAEGARLELEKRVQLITREIEDSYQQTVALQKERAAKEERERIARDLHDDLGARLLTLVHRSEDSKTSESARDALSDLRLLIGHLNEPEVTLADALSDWRAEADQRCDAAGRQLSWISDPLPEVRCGTRQKITLGRVLREAVTNILKHTDSSWISIQVFCDDRGLAIGIEDHSASAPVAEWKSGNGLRNLRQRAEQIGASLEWQDCLDASGRKTGTRVRCELPLSALSQAEANAP